MVGLKILPPETWQRNLNDRTEGLHRGGPVTSIDVSRIRYVWNTLYLALAPHSCMTTA
jgi:hypothetical protein